MNAVDLLPVLVGRLWWQVTTGGGGDVTVPLLLVSPVVLALVAAVGALFRALINAKDAQIAANDARTAEVVRILTAQLDEITSDRDDWKRIAWSGTAAAEHGAGAAEHLARSIPHGRPR